MTTKRRNVEIIARCGDERGDTAFVQRRGGHYYVVTIAEAFTPRAGERTYLSMPSRAAALAYLREIADADVDASMVLNGPEAGATDGALWREGI